MTGIRAAIGLALTLMALTSGCARDIERDYGRTRGKSVNGIGTLSALMKAEGHQVRVATRLSQTLSDWADVVVRFSPKPGPPAIEEANWYGKWLADEPGRALVYVPRDFDAEPGYWADALARVPATGQEELKAKIERRLANTEDWVSHIGSPAEDQADAATWFGVDAKAKDAKVVKALEGPWSDGIEAKAAALPVHQGLTAEFSENVLLRGDGSVLALDWSTDNEGRVLVLTNGSFTLNAALLNKARRPLAAQVVRWVGPGPLRVAFVEGGFVTAEDTGSPGLFHLLSVPPFGWIFGHLAALGLAASLFKAPRLGRARSEPPAGVEQPAEHPMALGRLLARTRDGKAARDVIQAYRRWRFPTTPQTRPERP
jgi:hypothetical protein